VRADDGVMLSRVDRCSGVGVPSNLPIDGHSFRRVEVLTGTPRRRRWGAAAKAAIVAESLAPGAVTSEIGLRHGLHRNQLYGWRREYRSAAVADTSTAGPDLFRWWRRAMPVRLRRRSRSRSAT
jgi:transposase-like protein